MYYHRIIRRCNYEIRMYQRHTPPMSACMYVSLKLDTFLMQQEKENIYWEIKGNKQVLLYENVYIVSLWGFKEQAKPCSGPSASCSSS